jgi:hypothetical protein
MLMALLIIKRREHISRTELLGAVGEFRRPDGWKCQQVCRNKSTSHVMHCEQKSLSDAYFEELQRNVIEEKTMGLMPKPVVRRSVLPSKVAGGTPCTLQSAEGALKKKASLMEVDTHKSTIPIQGPIKAVHRSTYNVRACLHHVVECFHMVS